MSAYSYNKPAQNAFKAMGMLVWSNYWEASWGVKFDTLWSFLAGPICFHGNRFYFSSPTTIQLSAFSFNERCSLVGCNFICHHLVGFFKNNNVMVSYINCWSSGYWSMKFMFRLGFHSLYLFYWNINSV